MKIRPGLVVALAALIALTSCSPHRDVLAKNGEAQTRWYQQGLADYRFHFKRLCECKYDYMREAWITVSNGEIVDITFADDQSQVPREMWNDFPTVADMFQTIEAAATENAYEIRVTYDPYAGYPQSIFIDHEELIADEETIWQAGDLQVVTAQPPQTDAPPRADQLHTPRQAEGRFADTVQGCSLLSRDGGSVGCYREVLDMGFVEDWLELFWVGSSEPKDRLHLYSGHLGAEFDPATVNADGIAVANELLREDGYENVGTVLDPHALDSRITVLGREMIVNFGQRVARAPLPAFDPELIIDGFQGDPLECLAWLPTQITVFEREAIAAVRLEPIARWNQDPGSPCYQQLGPDDEPFNDEMVGPEAGRTVVVAAGMTWPTSQQAVEPPITSAPPVDPPTQTQQAGEPPTVTAPPPVQVSSREASIAAIEQQGGTVRIDTDKGLVAVSLVGEQFTDAALSNLKEIPDATNLSIYNSKVTDAGLASLAGLDQLQSLTLAGTGFTDAGLVHVGELTGLTSLWISDPQIGDAGLLHLQGLKLQSLILEGTRVSDSGLEHLQAMRDSLRLIRLARTEVTDAGLAHLAGFNELYYVGLGNTQVTDAGLVTLSGLPKLFTLDLPHTAITDTGLEQLSGLNNLVNLDVAHTAVTDAGLETLKGLPNLRSLNLDGTSVTDAGVQGLKQALPNLSVYRPSPDG